MQYTLAIATTNICNDETITEVHIDGSPRANRSSFISKKQTMIVAIKVVLMGFF